MDIFDKTHSNTAEIFTQKYKLVYQFGSIFAGSKYHSGQLYSRTRAKLSTPNIDLAARTD